MYVYAKSLKVLLNKSICKLVIQMFTSLSSNLKVLYWDMKAPENKYSWIAKLYATHVLLWYIEDISLNKNVFHTRTLTTRNPINRLMMKRKIQKPL